MVVGTLSQSEEAAADPGEFALKYEQNLRENLNSLRDYTWQSRVEVREEGKLLYTDLVINRFDASGKMQSTEKGRELAVRKRQGVVRGNLQEGKLRSVTESVSNLKQWIRSYVFMSRGTVVDFFGKAKKVDSPTYEDAIFFQATNVAQSGDTVTLHVDKVSGSPIRLTFSTPVGKKSQLNATVHFRHLRTNSAFYADQVDANIMEKEKEVLRIKVENFDFVKGL